ncbi:RING-H2 finger protein ATL57-like [Punica granatum]|uniref:RING-type E3 ubiquitin transferase n=2 Tax=Punica granatum TaxID=22663 RepID=A0A218W9Q2_PUNGR|nr:RING-H2 finger protein ATL57-like [Punica granatum]OWM68941.1 hypothetical protein CDL15_Pgr025128 [Punica granatum]PKI78800.1 hypothetical protein CRG98_000867 [Punica granatum]
METRPCQHRRCRILLYHDSAPYTTSIPPSPPILFPRHSSSLPPFGSPGGAATTTSRHTLRQPPPLTRPLPLAPDPPFDSSVALTILILLGALFFMGFFSIYIRRFADADDTGLSIARGRRRHLRVLAPSRSRRPPSGGPSRWVAGKGVDPAVIRALPTYAYDGSAKYQVDCPVCLSEFVEAETVKVIPHCEHVFHVHCIDQWLQSHESCPVCRATQLLEVARPSYVADQVPDACPTGINVVAQGTSAAVEVDTCAESGAREASRAIMKCSSWSDLGRGGGDSVGGRQATMYRTLSF